MAEELILRLKKKRAVNRSYLTKTCNKIESGLDTLMRIELEELLEQLNESFNELKVVDHEIETLLETDDLEKELQGVEEYREKYITWRFRANKKIRQSDFQGENIPNSNSRIDENEMRHYVPSCTTVKLPKLMISKFYGNFSEWLTFWNSFDAAIHQNNSLNPIDKFNYLKSHLGGTALNTVEGFALSADNYEKAIKLLKDRFGREDILISRHMNNLLSMRPLKTSSDVRTFRELFDNLSVHIRSLESLNVSIDVYGQLLCPIIIKLLPADLNLELNKELPTGYVINDLITFLERQLTAREKSFRNEIGTGNESTSKPNLVNKHPKTRFYNEKPIATASELLNSVHKSNECVFCGKDNHGSPKCDFAANISLNEKRSLMKKKGVCYKCLRPSHLSKFCRNVVRCSICNMSSHLDVMCTKLILDRGGSSKSPTVQDETLANLSTSPDVLLPTLRVTLKGNRTEKTARAIIDTGSQRSYILHSTAMEMEYEQSRREFFRHSLFGGSSTDVVEHEVYTIHLSDINNSYRCEFEALGQPLICGSIPPVCPRSLLEGSEELDVSDLMRDRIEVLIGADIAGRLLTDDQRRISSGLVAIRTKLGWTVMGKIPPTEVRDDISSLCVTTLLSLDLENLWKLDAIGVSDAEVEKKTQSLQAEMEEHFAHTTTRDIEGRYEVALPWVQDKERIPSNKDLAENQLRSVRRKLEEVGDMKEYGQIFEEWMKQGIIEYAREDKLDGVHYLPHRPVYKRNSQTSRIRPVFNASARKRGKLSLNDCLDKGPNLIEIIPRLLNKFRKYEVGVSSDIEKAFLQIGIKEEDRDYLRFLWHTEDGRLITYRHKRVVFGITTSPYLLKATLSLHLDKAPEHLKITAEQLKSSFYVDNCLSSFQNVEETEKFVKESTELLSTACFNLRDWVSNVTDFSLMNQLNKEVNILGITWNTDRDTLTIGLEDFELIGPTTKRKVLSIASKIFDPLGVACPVTLIPKLILQETWIQKLTWDEVLPGCLVQRFWKWFSKLKHLPNIEIPRWLCFKDSYVEKTTLHIFCDASQFAYATCIFLRIEKEDRVDIQLIQARTRVAPLKKLTIPRLELLACLIGARLAANVIQDLEFEEIPRFYWTDSTNALCWIQREDNWAAFVMNRVKEIHNLSSPESWRHIPGRLNPADLPSRGCSAESLKETRWWEGPAWLKVSQEEWPKSTIIPDLEIVYSERRKTILNTLCTTRENENLFGRYSHFLRIVRITAWIYRFFNNAKIDRRKIISEDLSTEEITKSEIILIRLIQRESFSGHEDKKLQGFKLLVDSSGILRIKTKICRREDFANFRMPILLPSDHFLVSLLIRWNHETHGHAGLQTLLSILRENYWILRSRKTVKKIINQCIRCKRFTATPATVESTSLPEDRVRDAAVFEIVGVDLTGHLILKNKKKAWIVIFTCAVYRGVHLELVTSLSMEAFLQAFRRFIARRGRPLIVYSDNGTNFKGIANALKKIDFSRLKCDPTLKNITWKFIPPGAPWWGGWWERLIGMMKQLLFRILGQTSLGYEELSTVMCDVESLMNTRPLTYLTEESEDLAPLTPSLFLHEVREVGVPDLDLIDNQTLSRKYQYIKRVREDLRERFRIEYFGFLRQETRRLKTTIPLKVGDMVLIGQESLKRLHWPLARIIQLYPGKDGLVRVAKVKTSSGDKIRPIQKLYNLEITPEIRCRDPLTERSPTQEVRLTTEEDPLTSQQEQHHIDTPNVVSSYGRPIKRPNQLDLLNFSFPCLSRRDANSKVGEMLEKKTSEAANGRPAEAATGMQRQKNEETIQEELVVLESLRHHILAVLVWLPIFHWAPSGFPFCRVHKLTCCLTLVLGLAALTHYLWTLEACRLDGPVVSLVALWKGPQAALLLTLPFQFLLAGFACTPASAVPCCAIHRALSWLVLQCSSSFLRTKTASSFNSVLSSSYSYKSDPTDYDDLASLESFQDDDISCIAPSETMDQDLGTSPLVEVLALWKAFEYWMTQKPPMSSASSLLDHRLWQPSVHGTHVPQLLQPCALAADGGWMSGLLLLSAHPGTQVPTLTSLTGCTWPHCVVDSPPTLFWLQGLLAGLVASAGLFHPLMMPSADKKSAFLDNVYGQSKAVLRALLSMAVRGCRSTTSPRSKAFLPPTPPPGLWWPRRPPGEKWLIQARQRALDIKAFSSKFRNFLLLGLLSLCFLGLLVESHVPGYPQHRSIVSMMKRLPVPWLHSLQPLLEDQDLLLTHTGCLLARPAHISYLLKNGTAGSWLQGSDSPLPTEEVMETAECHLVLFNPALNLVIFVDAWVTHQIDPHFSLKSIALGTQSQLAHVCQMALFLTSVWLVYLQLWKRLVKQISPDWLMGTVAVSTLCYLTVVLLEATTSMSQLHQVAWWRQVSHTLLGVSIFLHLVAWTSVLHLPLSSPLLHLMGKAVFSLACLALVGNLTLGSPQPDRTKGLLPRMVQVSRTGLPSTMHPDISFSRDWLTSCLPGFLSLCTVGVHLALLLSLLALVVAVEDRLAVSYTSHYYTSSKMSLRKIALNLDKLHRDTQVTFQWIPSHIGLKGNDTADAIAKSAAIPNLDLDFDLFKCTQKRNIETKIQESTFHHWYLKQKPGSILECGMNRLAATSISRLKTGHTRPLLFQDGVKTFPQCTICRTRETSPDHLLECMGASRQDLYSNSTRIVRDTIRSCRPRRASQKRSHKTLQQARSWFLSKVLRCPPQTLVPSSPPFVSVPTLVYSAYNKVGYSEIPHIANEIVCTKEKKGLNH
ncbi:hypothetical protein LAZ67_3000757 [Cordylochernes scorpioides]|uniref:Integrase catalytic domain-containing protein n=1 Tax=Cordylochernes scorpioides TaxID=51811 RepID=A0ABY6K805_9ARAC|nr:hypothetical protein LAZ67_3000757 [Cordylochernes scorpioides]